MEKQVRAVKIYTVEIVECKSTFWYSNKVGELYTAILVSKEIEGGFSAAFAVVEKVNDKYRPPTMIRTIRPEDCFVVTEEIELYSNMQEFRRGFGKIN